jgi:hypothetical protein
MNQDEARLARIARIRANRGTPERIAIVEAIKEAQAATSRVQPEGPVVEGFAHELRTGDYVLAVGGKYAGVNYKRHGIRDFVEIAGRTPGQRTRGHVVFRTLGDYQLHTFYPVRYVRPVA